MAENEWGDLEAKFVTTLREQKIEAVPEPIVKLAQKSLDGVPHPDGDPEHKLHAMQWEGTTVERAAAFARHMRNAGPHTTPPSSVVVVIDPDRKKVDQYKDVTADDGTVTRTLVTDDKGKPVKVWGPVVNPKLVAFRAGARRGRATS